MVTSWDDYLAAAPTEAARTECRAACGGAFEPLRRIIEHVVADRRPRTIACLGAGMLNDIPFGEFVKLGADIHFVDWIPGIVDAGLAHASIARDPMGDPRCVHCALGPETAPKWCRKFAGAPPAGRSVCRNFDPADQSAPVCRSYERGERPFVHYQDITRGYASAFARETFKTAKTATSWRQAFKQARRAAQHARPGGVPVDIPAGGVDLVTSSMVMSQFAHEPYDYFSRQVAARLGPPSAQEERQLAPALEWLQDALTFAQIEIHLDEIERIMAPDGRLFVAFEMFHYDAAKDAYFLVRDMHRALEILDRRFVFDVLPDMDSMVQVRVRGQPSVVHAYLLRRRTAGNPSGARPPGGMRAAG